MNAADHIVVAGAIAAEGMDILAAADAAVTVMDAPTPDAIAAAVTDADALVIRTATMPAACIADAGRLRVVSRHGVGYDNLPIPELTAAGIPVTVVGAVNAVPVAEHALWMCLTLARNGVGVHRRVADGRWREGHRSSVELDGCSLLLLGCGRVGSEVARRANAFGMRVSGVDPGLTADALAASGITKVDDWKTAIGDADFVSVHVPFTAATRGLINADAIAAMKDGAFLINTARGGVVDEGALVAALRDGKLGGAGVDVFSTEPPAADNVLLSAATDGDVNLILSPHSAAHTTPCLARMAAVAAQNAVDGLAGKLNPQLVINPETLNLAD